MQPDVPRPRRGFFFVSLTHLLFIAAASPAADQTIDFVRDVQPILQKTCYSCHGPEKQKGELRLDSKPLAMKGGQTGVAIIAGDSKKSYLMQRVRGEGEESRMPHKAEPFTPAQVATLAKWIDQGAAWPDSASVAGAKVSVHWAYVKPARPAEPAVKNTAWRRNPIDAFVLEQLEKNGLAPSPDASKETLLRRVSLDLTGLPPSVEEMDGFLKDTTPGAYEKAVDRLLASPHYGERWARVWLDAARYADTDGFNFDSQRVMWKFRDWVISALNADMSFKQFTIEQIAGDMLPNAAPEQLVASGFHRNTMKNTEGGVDPEEARWETLLDRTHTTATVWLGSTLACAQCHNHKYDPFTQKDYYGFLAFFDNCDEITINAATGLAGKSRKSEDSEKPSEVSGKDSGKPAPKAQATALAFRERATAPQTDLRIRGAFTSKGERVPAATPKCLPPLPASAPRNRLGLAEWLASDENPLTARVAVNRCWETFFGRNLMETPEDFGAQGQRPTHPKLLDWLATEFMRGGWKSKALHRLIVTSATYRQSSKVSPDLLRRDPANKLYARGPRFRMEAEMLRDNALAVSGVLSRKMGGPSVFPPAPPELGRINNNKESIKWTPSPGEDRFRRGVYIFACRTAPYSMFGTFDGPSREFCCVKRPRTTTPLQALGALNDPFFFECAQGLARRVLREAGSDAIARLACAFRLCTGRKLMPGELDLLAKAYAAEFQHFSADKAAAEAVNKSVLPLPAGVPSAELAALTMISNVLLNMDETVTKE